MKLILYYLYNKQLEFPLLHYIKESGVSYTTYNSRTDEPIWLKIGGEVA